MARGEETRGSRRQTEVGAQLPVARCRRRMAIVVAVGIRDEAGQGAVEL